MAAEQLAAFSEILGFYGRAVQTNTVIHVHYLEQYTFNSHKKSRECVKDYNCIPVLCKPRKATYRHSSSGNDLHDQTLWLGVKWSHLEILPSLQLHHWPKRSYSVARCKSYVVRRR